MSSRVILDTDFMNVLLASDNVMSMEEEKSAINFFESIFEILDLNPVVHEYIYEQELLTNKLARKLVDDGYILKIRGNDFLKTPKAKKNYMVQVRSLYKTMKLGVKELRIDSYEDLLSFHEKKSNLGEILSVLMARELKLPCFFSNDKDAKKIVKAQINTENFSLEVLNIFEVFEKADKVEDKKLDSKMVKYIKNKIEDSKKKKGSK